MYPSAKWGLRTKSSPSSPMPANCPTPIQHEQLYVFDSPAERNGFVDCDLIRSELVRDLKVADRPLGLGRAVEAADDRIGREPPNARDHFAW